MTLVDWECCGMCPEIVDVAILLARTPQDGRPMANIKVS